MALSAEFSSRVDRVVYPLVAAGAAALSYEHARSFLTRFMGRAGGSATPLLLDAVVFWLASAAVRQARAGRPLPMLRAGGYVVLALTLTANALGGATPAQRMYLALPAALFGFLSEVRTRLALYHYRAAHGDDRLRARLWLRYPARTARAWLWLARQSAPAFDRAAAERDQLRAARDAVKTALPGWQRRNRRARAMVLRELRSGRLSPAAAVSASGLQDRAGVPELHRAALAAAFGAGLQAPPAAGGLPSPPGPQQSGEEPGGIIPVSSAPRHARTAAVLSARPPAPAQASAPAGGRDLQDRDRQLIDAAIRIREQAGRDGITLSRKALADRVREQGHPIANGRRGWLWEASGASSAGG